MDLEQMKSLWQQQEQEIKHNRMLNEKIISTMLKEKSATSIRKMSGAEYLGAGLCAMLVIIFLLMAGRIEGTAIIVCYIFSLLFIVASLVFSLYKVNYLSRTDLGKPVAETTKRIQQFRLLIVKERLWSLILFPALILCVLAVVTYWIEGNNIFDNFSMYLPKIIIGVLAGIPIALVVYRRVYMNSIRQVNDSLKELEEFVHV